MYRVEGGKKLAEILETCLKSNLSLLISGPPGVGKSLPPDEKITVISAKTGGSAMSMPISEVNGGDRVIGINQDNKTEVTEVKHKIAFDHEGEILTVKTRSGKTVRATPDHSFLVLDVESRKFLPCKGSDLKEGVIIPGFQCHSDELELRKYIQNPILYEKVVSIKRSTYKGLVYDLETDTHNFMTSQGIFVHNSEIFMQTVQKVSENFTVLTPREVRLYLMEPGEAKGIPWLVDKKTVWSRPDWLPEVEDSVLFFDDLHLVNEYNQSPLYELLLCSRLHGHMIPESTRFVAAGNIGLSSASASEIMAPIMDRFDLFIEFIPSHADFTSHAIAQHIDDRIINFIQSYGYEYLFTADPSTSSKFPSPRSWFSLDKALKAGFPIDVATGVVGIDAGARIVDSWNFLSSSLDDILGKNLESMDLKDQVAAAAFLSGYQPTDRILMGVKKLNPDARACYFRLVLMRHPDKITWLYQNSNMKEIVNELAAILDK